MFNADLALSVTMTAISTVLSIFTLPANLLLYANLAYEADVTAQLDWRSVFVALVVVISAIALGLYCSARSNSLRFNVMANKVRSCLAIWEIPGGSFSNFCSLLITRSEMLLVSFSLYFLRL